MNLYEINSQILDCIDQETGEVMDIDRLEELNMAKAEKVDNIACWVKNLEADVVAFEAQEKAFADRKAAAKRKIDSLKHYLTDALGGQNFSSDRCAVSFRRSKAVCVLDEAAVPAEYMTDKQHRGVKLVNALRNAVQAKWPDHFCVIKLEPDYAPVHHE